MRSLFTTPNSEDPAQGSHPYPCLAPLRANYDNADNNDNDNSSTHTAYITSQALFQVLCIF